MTTGTKVFLAVFAALVGVMVLYYGVLLPKPQLPPPISVATHDESAVPITTGRTETVLPLAANSAPPPGVIRDSAPSLPNVETAIVDPIASNLGPVDAAPSQPAVTPPLLAVLTNEPPLPSPPQSPSNPISPPVANQPVSIGPSRTNPTQDYIVQAGDTMSSIAESWFGDPNKWSLIARENPLVDPNRLAIGDKLRLPPKDAKPAPVEKVVKNDATFTVRSGDTLAKIAREYFGDVAKWKAIYDANRSVIGDDPAALKPGMKLKMPPKSG